MNLTEAEFIIAGGEYYARLIENQVKNKNKNNVTDLEKFQLINACETVEDLTVAIEAFADPEGLIQGRTRMFDAHRMVRNVQSVIEEGASPNLLTREFGIRQQALYIRHYT